MTKVLYDWNGLYNRALEKSCLDPELKAKDNARAVLRQVILAEEGYDIDECECPEDEIDDYLNCHETIWFDESGYFMCKTY